MENFKIFANMTFNIVLGKYVDVFGIYLPPLLKLQVNKGKL